MNKFKTHKGISKRFKLSSKGKPRYKKSFAGHLMSGKSGRRCQRLRQTATLEGALAQTIRRALHAE